MATCRLSSSSSRTSTSSLVLRPLPRTTTTPSPFLPLSARRHKASASRTKRALNIAPHPSFLTSSVGSEHIIFNPPAAEPSVLHTPFKFLPKSDPRRRDNLPALFSNGRIAAAAASSSSELSPPPVTTTTTRTTTTSLSSTENDILPPLMGKKMSGRAFAPMTAADVAEMRRLRAEDPEANSVAALARRFGCAKIFVMMCCHAPRAHQDRRRQEAEAVRTRWGPRRAGAHEERKRRLEMLFKGEI